LPVIIALLLFLAVSLAQAQTSTGVLRGKVTDPSGAVVPQATVMATTADGRSVAVVSNNQGVYEFKGLPAGSYTVTTVAKGFASDQEESVNVVAGQAQQLDIGLQIQVEQQHVEVQEETPTVDVSPETSASTLVIKGKDLEALSDDPDELQAELEALAGPSAGPNGGQIYVDGFTAGQLPPKSAIREIRINQNPFSAQYDKLGYGRIEIFTKPGTDQVHGQVMVNGNTSAFNALNPFVTEEPGYYSEIFNGNISGPLGKKASYFFTVQQRNIDNVSVVVAQVLNPNNQIVSYNTTVPSPSTVLNISPRFDFQLTPSNTLTVRYQYVRSNQDNSGVGGFSLPSVGSNSHSSEQTVQISDTQVISPTIVNETRFQYIRNSSNQLPLSTLPTLYVQGAFTGGGSSAGAVTSNQDHYELQNYTSIAHGHHFIKFGGRLRDTLYSSNQNSGFNGAYNFSSLNAYQITQVGLQEGLTPQQIRAMGGGASQFSLTTGQPLSDVSMLDIGLYVEDEWRIKPNISLTAGLRYETQTGIPYHGDWAPRIALAWGLGHGKTPKTVLRAGYGIFYDRFSYNYLLEAERLNGVTQVQYIVADPNFYPLIPPPSLLAQLATTSPTVYQVAPNLQPGYTLQTAFSVERQLTKSSTLSVTYLNARGVHQLFLRNANAPLPGTYPPSDVRPDGGTTNVYQYSSEGNFIQNQLITNFRINVGKWASLFGFYSLNFANCDLGAGAGGGGGSFFGGGSSSAAFVMNSYDPADDWGRAGFDVRNRFVLGGSISLKYGLRLNPFIVAQSGAPFNIIVGQDLNGDSIFNDRPALGNVAGPGGAVYMTQWGTFNSVPLPGQPIAPINTGSATPLFTLNMRLSKTFGLGPKLDRTAMAAAGGGQGGSHGGGGGGHGGGGGLGGRGFTGGGGNPFAFGNETTHKYNLTFTVSVRNLLNNVNYAPPVGTLDSPIFGTPNALAGPPFSSGSANRRIDLQMLFSF
jgi:hypothetical protein